jgi:glycosyltransferase involved in cell wall biosynthesis
VIAGQRPLWLVVHGSAEHYGSDKVLLATMAAMRDDPAFVPVVVLHEDGPLRAALYAAGVEVHVGGVTKIRRAMFTPGGMLRLPGQIAATGRMLETVAAGRPVGLVYSNTLAVLGAAVWAWRRRLPHLWHVHEILQHPTLVRRGLPWVASRLSGHVLANSRQTQIWLEAEQPGLRGRTSVAFNGLAEAPVATSRSIEAFRRSVGASDGDVVATLVGRFNHMKGQTLLVEALRGLRDVGRLGRLRVALVGDVYAGHKDYRAECAALIESVGLAERVTIMPFTNEIGPVWRGTDVAVVASTEPESFGMVAIEAMACSVPVVAAAHGGLLDIVDDEVTGLLFQPRDAAALADALARLAGDAALRARLGAAGAARQAQHFSLAAQVAQTRAAGLALMQP